MGPDSLAELDPRPRAVRSVEPQASGPLPQMARAFLAVTALGCALAAALLGLAQPSTEGAGTLYAALALLGAAATRLPARWLGHGLGAVLVLLTAALAGTALLLGWGLAGPGLQVLPVLVCVLCAVSGWRAGVGLTGVAAAALLAVALLGPAPAIGGPPLVLHLSIHLIILGCGLAGGIMLARVAAGYMRAAQQRELRFRSLLGLAADASWEIDHRYRLVAAAGHAAEPRRLTREDGIGAVPWELAHFGCETETLDALQADLDARLPFRDLPITWGLREGRPRVYLASGEPRFDERGIFKGYWGVARDVTEMHNARAALAATETRYQELFSRIPTPLVLHRGGHVIEVNPAALAMFGHADARDMVGTDILAAYESGDSRERARRRMELLQGEPVGTALPVADFRLRVRGRRVSVRATSVRVDTEVGAAVLAIFVDDTERLAAEDAVRRSESMLAHLVATSPDLITLTELASGRYAMVNHAFERLIGWSAAEAVGRTSTELGVWGSGPAREQFVATINEHGQVSDLPVPFVTKGGGSVSMLVSAARFVMDQRDYVVINARDVTERERERLEREAILANASIGIAVTRGERYVLVNRHFEQIFGWGPGELDNQPAHRVWDSEAAYADAMGAAAPALSGSAPVEFERLGRRKDGTDVLVRLRGRAIDPARPADGGTVWTVEDVTERRQFEQQLARARDDAEAASRAKSAFLANTSHELRTPLNGMIGLARLARAPDIGEERRRQYLDQIADSAQALAGIISDILDLSKIEAGKLQIESTTFELGELLRTLQQTYAPLATARGLALQVEIDAAVDGCVAGDPLRVRQVISNFLNNALKFTQQGQVQLRARRSGGPGDSVRIEVQDTGPGIDDATRARLFEPFTQADQSTTRRFGGTGLGLSICRELATLMGGEVGVDSSLGAGSCFWAVLPLPAAQRSAGAPMPPAGEGSLDGARVLMVEDNPVNMMIAAAMLERWGVTVTQAQDGREAVTAVEEAATAGQPFDAVLMDVQMPVMSGHEATRALRGMPVGRGLPIIALTAAALVSEREEALRSGMNDFLTKPIDADKLKSALLRWRLAAVGD